MRDGAIERKAVCSRCGGRTVAWREGRGLYTVSGAKEGVEAQLRPLTRCSCHERGAIVCTRPTVWLFREQRGPRQGEEVESGERERERERIEAGRNSNGADLGEQTDWNVLRGLVPKHPSLSLSSFFSLKVLWITTDGYVFEGCRTFCLTFTFYLA